ncbi:MAG: hypothetical protein NVS9B1_11170 [Candidatus Dormibacteraceae bacterium]
MSEERRIVTVLFADVTGSTAMGEELDPEEVRGLLGRYYAIAKEVVTAHGGTLEKFIGDAVMAVFGLPVAHGDDAERAVAAALALRDRVRGEPGLGDRLAVRFGLSTGEVVASLDRSAGDFLVTGDAVNVAARMQQAAEPWEVLATDRTAHAAAARFEFDASRPIEARGKSAPIPAHAVRGMRTVARPLTRIPFVGRDGDLEQLQLVARRAFSERRPSLVSVIAPAGTGKTRLLEEFLDWLAARGEGARVAIAQCLPYGQQLTYWPMRQVLFSLIGVTEDASPEEVRAASRAWLDGVGGDPGGAELLAATIGMGGRETPDRSLLFAAWRDALEAATRTSPLVIVFEDLHWSSDSLLDLVEFLMQPRGEAPVMMIALTRPELLDRRPTWGGGRRNHLALSLEPLADRAVVDLVGHLLEGARPDLVETIVERSEGNPFYAGELVRSALEQGGGDRLPDTVQATVLARLDLLPAAARRTLQIGSIFGRSFRIQGLAALDPGLAELPALCDDLVARDLIRPADGDRYAFRHILIREVAYTTLPRVERARLHAAAGDWMESRASGREVAVAEIIAFHFKEAATLATATDAGSNETARVRAAAVRWLSRALEVAAAVEATPEAVRHVQAALNFAGPGEIAHLQERLGDIQGGDNGVQAYDRALELYEAAGASATDLVRVLAGSLMWLMRMQGSIGNRPTLEEMDRRRARGEALMSQTADPFARARFRAADAFYPFWLQAIPGRDPQSNDSAHLEAANASAMEALTTAEAIDSADLMSAALDALGSLATVRQEWVEVKRLARQRLEFADRLTMLERGDAYGMVAWSCSWLGDLAESDSVSEAGLRGLQPGQAPAVALHMLSWRLYAMTLLGRWGDVPRLAATARGYWVEAGRMAALYAIGGLLSAIDVARARHDRVSMEAAADVLGDILNRAPTDNPNQLLRGYAAGDPGLDGEWPPFTRVPVHTLERRLSLACDAGMNVVERAAVYLPLTQEYGYRVLEMQCRRSLGLTRQEPAELERALAIAGAIGSEPSVGRLQCELGRLKGDAGAAAAGRALLGRLGDVDYLESHSASDG